MKKVIKFDIIESDVIYFFLFQIPDKGGLIALRCTEGRLKNFSIITNKGGRADLSFEGKWKDVQNWYFNVVSFGSLACGDAVKSIFCKEGKVTLGIKMTDEKIINFIPIEDISEKYVNDEGEIILDENIIEQSFLNTKYIEAIRKLLSEDRRCQEISFSESSESEDILKSQEISFSEIGNFTLLNSSKTENNNKEKINNNFYCNLM